MTKLGLVILTVFVTCIVLTFSVLVHKAGYKHGQTDMCFEIGHETDFDPLMIRTCKKIKIELSE